MPINSVLALDIGTVRIGVARANTTVRIPEPLQTILNDENTQANLKKIIDEYSIDVIIVGLPRNMDGLETKQTEYVRTYTEDYIKQLGLPIIFQDETLSSVAAENYLSTDTNKHHSKSDIDAHAAVIIIGDYLESL